MEAQRTIEDIAYLIKNAKNKPIILLGAGASVSAGIPLANKIIEDVLEIHKEKPSIRRLKDEHKKDYYKLMEALSAQERRSLFYEYINNEQVKLNVTHIYLAQMLKEGLIDYVLTVNFDDLMLKACAMFNFIPPVYDVSILNDFTTTTFLEKSVTYLHGQHHGPWLLNAEGELTKVKQSIPKIFERICHDRTWIVIGYSGEDEILDEIANVGSFENELYWVGYNDSPVSDKVQNKLFTNPQTNAYHIKGYDSDSFFLKIHSELGIQTPEIFNKPFSFLKTMLETVRDIQIDNNSDHRSLFEGIQERMEISKKQVSEAIDIIENKESEEQLIQRIIEKGIKRDFSLKDAIMFEDQIERNNYHKAKQTLGNYYGEWGIKQGKKFRLLKNQADIDRGISNFEKAIELNPNNGSIYSGFAIILFDCIVFKGEPYSFNKVLDLFEKAMRLDSNYNLYYNWGTVLSDIGTITKSEKYFKMCFKKFQKAKELSPEIIATYFNWGSALNELSTINNDKKILLESIAMYRIALELDEKNIDILNNLGVALKDLAILEDNDNYFEESILLFRNAIKISSENDRILYNLGMTLFSYNKKNTNAKLLSESFHCFTKVLKINPQDYDSYNNCGIIQSIIAKNKNDINLFEKSFDYFKNAIKIEPQNSKAFFNWGNAISLLAEIQTDEILFYESIEMYKQALRTSKNDDEIYSQLALSELNVGIINKSEFNYWDSFSNFEQALEINPNNANALNNWSFGLLRYSYLLETEEERKITLLEGLEKGKKAYSLGENPYNLSCIYAVLNDKENALKYLNETLERKLIQTEYVNNDNDWDNLKSDPGFINLLNIYK